MNVVIDGMDFAGKSTVCEEIAGLLAPEGIVVRRSTTSLTGGVMPALIRAVYRAPVMPDRLRSGMYHVAYVPDLIPRLPGVAARRLVLQESYVCRVWAYDLVHRRRMLGWVARWLAPRLHRRVDVGVLLRCPYSERRKRYLASGAVDGRDERRFSPDQFPVQQAMDAALARLAGRFGYRVVDTGGRTARQVAEQIIDVIGQVRNDR